MKPIDYIIIGGLAIVMIVVAVHLIKRKKQGKSGCGCGCGCKGCPSASTCHKEKSNDETV